MGGILLARASGLDGWATWLWSHWSADMNALWLMVFGGAATVLLLAVLSAKPILVIGSAFSTPGPLPGRYFGRRFKRWWRDVATEPPSRPARPPVRLRAWPMLDLKAGRLAALLLEPQRSPSRDPAAEVSDLATLERAVAHGRRLGWRHSSTAVIVSVSSLSRLLAGPRSGAWETLERYSGDEVATVPPLVLSTGDIADLPGEPILDRLARIRVGVALRADQLPIAKLPVAVTRVVVKAQMALAAPEAARALQTASRQLIVTHIPDMACLERLAKAGLHVAAGPVFGTPQMIE